MSEDKYKIAVRFFGGAGNYTEVLEDMFIYIVSSNPSEQDLLEWIKSNTRATSDDGIRRRLQFLEGVGLIQTNPKEIQLTEDGITWLSDTSPKFLYESLTTNVHGFDAILETLNEGPKTDSELGDAIASTHPDFGWTDDSGPAQHRGWLQSLDYVERTGNTNRLTVQGKNELERRRHVTEPQLTIGDSYTKSELEEELDTSFGSYIKGINPRTDDNNELEYILIKAREDGPYSDDLEGDDDERFTYIGEGVPEKGDQPHSGANKRLREQADRSTVPIYFFVQPADSDELQYEGLIEVTDAEYVSDGERRVYQFTMERLEIESGRELEELWESVEDETEIEIEDPPLTEDNEEFTTTQRRVRSSGFNSKVKAVYDNRCAICDARRESLAGTFEVEAAHIYPKRENGRDVVTNGLALCKLHHWAFDCGWLAVSDDYRILVADEPDLEGYEDFAPLEDTRLTLPANEDHRPHAKFLAAHRDRHGFESG
ncbi:HNH endonuclease [Halomontanus rarus]|uniref:HNH endonuclease n=1 Tax=Halomontanus rarus TaxID=3034020 RepID=UPI0023E7B407|nr:HNH endonuclease [Halovivax sp. TS33]